MGAKAIKLLIGALRFLFLIMPVSLSRMIRHSHSFIRVEIYHHINFIYNTFEIQILAVYAGYLSHEPNLIRNYVQKCG